jgi:hypothetical protein
MLAKLAGRGFRFVLEQIVDAQKERDASRAVVAAQKKFSAYGTITVPTGPRLNALQQILHFFQTKSEGGFIHTTNMQLYTDKDFIDSHPYVVLFGLFFLLRPCTNEAVERVFSHCRRLTGPKRGGLSAEHLFGFILAMLRPDLYVEAAFGKRA